jgi:hypothetical protein
MVVGDFRDGGSSFPTELLLAAERHQRIKAPAASLS